MGMKKDPWLEMFKYATLEPYSFLYLNAVKPKHLRIMKRFEKYLFHKELSEREDGGWENGQQDVNCEEEKKPRKNKK